MSLTIEKYFELLVQSAEENADEIIQKFPNDHHQSQKHLFKFPWDLESLMEAQEELQKGNKLPATKLLLEQLRLSIGDSPETDEQKQLLALLTTLISE